MTRLVPRPDWTPVEFVLAVRAAVWEQGVTPETAANRPTVLALFRPAEEPEPNRCTQCGGFVVEWSNGIGGGGASCRSCGLGWGRATSAPAPVAPPPAEDRRAVQVTITPDHTDLIPCRSCGATASPETINALQSALAALRSELAASQREVERLRGEMVTAQREAYVIGRRDGRLANNNPAPAKEEVVEGWRQVARNYYPAVHSGENRSEG